MAQRLCDTCSVLSETDKPFCPECGTFYDTTVDERGRGNTQPSASEAQGSAKSTPWKLIIGAGVAVVLVVVAFVMLRSNEPASPGVDGVLRVGACAVIDGEFATEVDCSDPRIFHYRVESIIAMDEECGPSDRGVLDRLGLGRVCLVLPSD